VSSGTAALDVAVAALGIGPGDEVILPTFTIISCASAIVRAGATPVVVDCDPHTWTMDVDQVARRIGPSTRAVMAVHIYGLPVDMTPLTELASRRGIAVIEDAAEALGARCDGRECGGFGTISALSFYANKHVTTGEGGMVLTDDETIAERCRRLRNLCFGRARRFEHDELGWNYRMTNLQAAVGVAQLERLDDTMSRKRAIGERYTALLGDLSGVALPPSRIARAENVYWVYGVVLDDDTALDAEEARGVLARRGVGTRPFFWSMHEQPALRARGLFPAESCPVAERIARRGFYLPSGSALTVEQQDRVVAAVRDMLS
jgi:perosamine synthetase